MFFCDIVLLLQKLWWKALSFQTTSEKHCNFMYPFNFSSWLRVKVNFWNVHFCPCEIPFSNQLYCLGVLFLPSLSQWKLMLPGFCPLPLFVCQPWLACNSPGNCFRGDKAHKIHFFIKKKKKKVSLYLLGISLLLESARRGEGEQSWAGSCSPAAAVGWL